MTKLHELMLSDDSALTAGVEGLRSRDELHTAWVELVRARLRDGRAAYLRGDLPETTPDEFMDGIARELGLSG